MILPACDFSAALTLDVTGDSAALGADESVTSLSLAVDVDWAYEVPDSASPETAIVELAAATGGDEATVTVERDAADPSEYGSVGGSGSLTIETGSA